MPLQFRWRGRNWLKRGDWIPLIPYPFRGIIMMAWVLLPIPYGIDYLSEDERRPNRLSFVEQAMPLPSWGAVMILAGAAASASLLMRWRIRSVISLHVLGALWATLSVGVFADSIGNWGGDGYRGAALFLAASITYWSAAIGYYFQGDENDGNFLVEGAIEPSTTDFEEEL